MNDSNGTGIKGREMEIFSYKVPALQMKKFSFIVGGNRLVKNVMYKNLKYIWYANKNIH